MGVVLVDSTCACQAYRASSSLVARTHEVLDSADPWYGSGSGSIPDEGSLSRRVVVFNVRQTHAHPNAYIVSMVEHFTLVT